MAKTFKQTATTYHVTAIYLDRGTFSVETVEFDINSKNQRAISKYVVEHYNCKNATDVNIADIKPITTTTSVTINASLDDIIAACKAAGIEIVYNDNGNVTDDDSDSADEQ